jgi:hypothetical protein
MENADSRGEALIRRYSNGPECDVIVSLVAEERPANSRDRG